MWFGIIKQLLPLIEGDMTICSPSTGDIALGLRPRAISPASGEQIVMSPSNKGNNCIMIHVPVKITNNVKFLNFRTPENFAVKYLKFKQRGQTIEYFVQQLQMEQTMIN